MTKETKIGLLVGLGFIGLFSIILAQNDKMKSGIATPRYAQVDAGPMTEEPLGSDIPLQNHGRIAVEDQLEPIVPIELPQSATVMDAVVQVDMPGQEIPLDDADIVPLPSHVVERLNLPAPVEERRIEPEAVVAAGTSPSLIPPVVTAEQAAVAVEPPVEPVRMASSQTPEPGNTGSSPANTKSTTLRGTHNVQRGESLGKIAAKYYGRSTPQRLQAIFDANRDQLKNVNDVRVGIELRIPELAGAPQGFEPAPQFVAVGMIGRQAGPVAAVSTRVPIPSASAAPDTSIATRQTVSGGQPRASDTQTAGQRGFRWYEIRSKDTLSRIASRELGDSKRYKEIYELNRDLLSDKNRIKPGTKIRLPVSDPLPVLANGDPNGEQT